MYENTWKCGELELCFPHPPEENKKQNKNHRGVTKLRCHLGAHTVYFTKSERGRPLYTAPAKKLSSSLKRPLTNQCAQVEDSLPGAGVPSDSYVYMFS